MPSQQRLSVALACADGAWPYEDWPAPDDRRVGRAVHLSRPFRVPDDADAVVLSCSDPATVFPELLGARGESGAPVIVISPCQDTETVLEVFRGGGSYLAQADYCACRLSSAVMAATTGHTYLSPRACAAVQEGVQRMSAAGTVLERTRALLSPRERQIMELLSTGLGAQEIGLRLRLSEKTVRNNLSNIYAKLDARGSTDAVLRWLGAAPVLRF